MGKGGHLHGKLLDRDLFAHISLIAVFLSSWREPGGFVWVPSFPVRCYIASVSLCYIMHLGFCAYDGSRGRGWKALERKPFITLQLIEDLPHSK